MNFVVWFEAAGAIASFVLIATAFALAGRAARSRQQQRHFADR